MYVHTIHTCTCTIQCTKNFHTYYVLTDTLPVPTRWEGRRNSVTVIHTNVAQPFDYSTLVIPLSPFSLFLTLTLSLFFHGQIISLSARLLGETPITLLHGPVLALHWPCISPYSGFPSAFATLVPACLPFVWPRLKLKVKEHKQNWISYVACLSN